MTGKFQWILRRTIPLALFWVFLTMGTAWANARPNIVIIMADDIGFECYGHKGSEFYETPNIDRLASTGVEFTQAYSQPLCTPSRVEIMTGRYSFRNYKQFGELDLTEPTFAKILKDNGYATAVGGKWQLSRGDLDGPRKAGFDEYCLWNFGKNEKNEPRYKSPILFENGVRLQNTKDKYGPDVVSDFLCEFIERNKEEPFLVYYPMLLTHWPYDPTPDSVDWKKTDKRREPIEHFREMVHYMDKMIGKVVAKLDETGLRENTLIIVTGDNGTKRSVASPLHSRGVIVGGKGSTTDAGNRVAIVANWPGTLGPGTIVDAPIGFADVLPTIAEVTGSTLPSPTDGQSLLALMKGESSKARGWMFQSYSKKGPRKEPFRCFVRDAHWKLYADGPLFNVPTDWLEESPVTGPEGDVQRERLQPILNEILRDVPPELIVRKTPR